MMEKIIPVGSWDFQMEPTALIKVASSGLRGSDRHSFLVKRAADHVFADLIDKITLYPGDIPIHTIAIGATEAYGCFAAGTPFALADGSYLPIEKVQEGDVALSADGHACEVSHLFRRSVPESVRLDVCGLADVLQCSTDHPFRVARKEQFVCGHDKHKRCLPPLQGQQNICNRPIHFVRDCVTESFPEISREWATAASLREGDFLVWTAPQLEPLWAMTVHEGYLLGAWLAEGSFQRNSSNRAVASIRLDLRKAETEFQSRLAASAAALSLGYRLHESLRDENSATVCVTGDPSRFRLWLATFREHAKEKIVPPWLCCLPKPVRLAIIAGYLDGDGSCCVDDKENRTTARSHGCELSLGLQRLCWSAGLPAVRCRAAAGWNISIANSYLADLAPFSWKVRGRELKQTTKVHGFYHEGRMYLPVRGITTGGPLDVFNVEIAGDHTYSGPNVDSHNCNRNGDGFNEDTCRKQAATFVGRPLKDWVKDAETHNGARFFRHHKNKDPEQSYGYVKAAAYNERMRRIELLLIANGTKEAAERNGGFVIPDSTRQILESNGEMPGSMACFTDPDYPILTRDRGYVPISQIRVGDFVWTHRGRWRRVTELRRRQYTGEVFKFHVNGHPFPLELTATHPMWAKVFTGSREVSSIKAKARRYFQDPGEFERKPADWHEAKDIGRGDLFFHRPVTSFTGYGRIASTDLAAVMGYYLAEGSFGYNGDKACTIEFTCNLDDSALRVIPQIAARLWPDVTVNIEPKENSDAACVLKIHSTKIAEFLRKQLGAGCKSKLIPPEIFNASRDVKLSLLGAWLDGDGWVDKKGLHWSTASYNLVLQGRDLLAALGISASIYKIDHANCETSGHPGSGIEYVLNLSHLDAWNLSEYSWKVAAYPSPKLSRRQPPRLRLCPDGSYALRIRDVESRFVSDVTVYNFEVEEDESYSAAGLISHNCKVAYDVCQTCFNKAATRAQYCTADTCINPYDGFRGLGCRYGLTKLAGNGRQQFVENPRAVFFDWSEVTRPADRNAFGGIASYLTKAASEGLVLGGAALAELYARDNGYEIGYEWTVPRSKLAWQRQLVSNLARIENELETRPSSQDYTTARAFRPSLQPPVDFSPLGKVGAAKAASGLSALYSRKALLSLPDFLQVVSGVSGEKIATHVAVVSRHLPGVFNRLAADPSLDQYLQANPFVGEGLPSNEQRKFAAKVAETRGCTLSAVQERLQRSALRGEAPVTKLASSALVKTSAADEPGEYLARQFALYKVAFLTSQDPQDPGFPLTSRMVVLQNYV